MRITKIESFSTDNLCVVRVTTEDGMTGYGQTAHNFTDITSQILHRQLAPIVLGMDSDDTDAVSDACVERTYKFYGSYINRAAAGIDTALWDMKAKRAGKSVAQLLGSTQKTVDVYGSSMDRVITPQAEADRMKRLQQTQGFRAFKLHIAAGGSGHDWDMYPGRTEEVVEAVRHAIGDSELYVDPNGAYSVKKAVEMAKFFAGYGVGYFEEPCPFWEMEMTREVARSIDMPVAGGEQDFCLAQWKRIIDTKAVAIAQPDITYIGGFSRALKVADMSRKAGLFCTPHNGTFNMLQVFSIHFNAAIQNPHPFMELSIDQDNFDPWTKGFFYPAVQVRDGKVDVPQEPGWGITVAPEWLEKAAYQVSEK